MLIEGLSNTLIVYFHNYRFQEYSRALYSLTVLAEAQNLLSVTIPEGKVNDISGNLNLRSNQLEVKHCKTIHISYFRLFISSPWQFFIVRHSAVQR